MSRPSFRPRPLDINQKLAVVRDPKEALDDISATRAVHHSHVALDKDNDEVRICCALKILILLDLGSKKYEACNLRAYFCVVFFYLNPRVTYA
jgi:hypothetical protein